MGHGGEIKNPGSFEVSSKTRMLFYALAGVGLVSFIFLFTKSSERAWSIFVTNHFYFLCLGLGGLFFSSIQWLTGAMWSAPVRRLSESFTAYLPFAGLTMIVLFIGIHDIYHWSHADAVANDPILKGKSGYLNTGFFIVRQLLAFGIWMYFSWKIIQNSIAQDSTGDYKITLRNRVLAPIFLILFAVTFTMASFDQLMSLDPHWFSTIFGVYCFAGLFYSNLAATCLLTIFFRRKGLLKGIVNDNHLHDIGKFMFAFVVFWAYIGFSQFMLIWYANLPEETGYYLRRLDQGWIYVSAFLLFGKFFLPFLLLLPRGAKRSESRLIAMAWFMLIAQWIDMVWIVQPEFFKEGPQIGFFEIGATLGFVGVFGLLVSRFLARNNIVAIGDPRLAESVHHHHQ